MVNFFKVNPPYGCAGIVIPKKCFANLVCKFESCHFGSIGNDYKTSIFGKLIRRADAPELGRRKVFRHVGL